MNLLQKTYLLVLITLFIFNNQHYAQYKLGSGNFWIYNEEGLEWKTEMTDTIFVLDSVNYYKYNSTYKIIGKINNYSVISEKYPKYYIGKLQNGLYEELRTYSNGTIEVDPYKYKENAKLGDRWPHRIIYDSDDSTNVDTLWAEVSAVFDGIVFNEIKEVKQIHYLTGFDYYRYFCEDYGELSETTIGGEVRSSLKGCYIDGMAYGDTSFIVVGVYENNLTKNEYRLSQNYPNPFNSMTNIIVTLPKSENVKITLFNSLGEKIGSLYDGVMKSGSNNIMFDVSMFNNISSGVYFYKLNTSSYSEIKRMIYLK